MAVKPKCDKALYVQTFYLNGEAIKTSKESYLGVDITDDFKDDSTIAKQTRGIYLTDAQDFTLMNILLAIIKKNPYKVLIKTVMMMKEISLVHTLKIRSKQEKNPAKHKVEVKSIKFKYKWKKKKTQHIHLHT